MVKKFECKTCKRHFEADDQNLVICPYCQSDNVDLCRSKHLSRWGWIVISVIFIVVLVCFAVFYPRPIDPPPGPDDSIISPGDSIVDPPTVTISEPSWSNDLMYSVKVEAKNVTDKMKFYYVMLSHFEQKVIQKNNDGVFSNIPHCNEDGHSYDFAIMDSNEDTLLCVPVEQTGFVKQITIDDDKKMTVEQLQQLIDKQDSSLNGVGENAYLAPNYKLEFSNLPSDSNIPESWTEIFEMLEFEIWKNVTVIKLNYDEKNRIDKITLKVSL